MAPKKKADVEENGETTKFVSLTQIVPDRTIISVIGLSPLIVHQWSEKERREMLDRQKKIAPKIGRHKVRDPEDDYLRSMYRDEEGYCAVPSLSFKNAAVTAVTSVSDLKKIEARQAFHFVGQWARIYGAHRMREDNVRIAMGKADLRYRAEFPEWWARLKVEYLPSVMSLTQLLSLVNLAGFAVGISEYRPERNGSYGRFRVALETKEDKEFMRRHQAVRPEDLVVPQHLAA